MATVKPGQMDPDTAYIRWDDHCALLARIRAAVDAERRETAEDTIGFTRGTGGSLAKVYAARDALDALLGGGADNG